MNKKCLLALAACTLMFAACGDDVTKINEVHQDGMAVLESGEKLSKQACDTTNVGEMLFVTDSSEVFFCDGKSWQTLKGEKGDDGKGCSTIDNGDGSVSVTCGEGEGATTTTIFKTMCGMKPYDPKKQFCDTRDNQIYGYVTIAEGDYAETWMAENLNYADSAKTPSLKGKSWCGGGSGTTEGDCSKYGRLYTWAAAIDSVALASDAENSQTCGYGNTCTLPAVVQGVCPSGWHLPTDAEWETLFTAVGGSSIAGKMLKSQTGWNDNENGEDAYGFSALPAGYRSNDGNFNVAGYFAYFWSATQGEYDVANDMSLYGDMERAFLYYDYKDHAFSVRCLQNN